ncbi:MAG TPA: preprotein translocase subunit SecG [Steroidobacteraceae bacterium]|nr:preprotein translocase subunit SecG [Steroidobacteraceae bacterium]
MLLSILMVIHILSAAFIVVLVLIQRGKGADAGAGFGAGASGTVFGARGATTALSRATAILATVFMVTSLTLAYMGTRAVKSAPDTVLDRLAEQERVPAPAVPAPQQPVAPPASTAPAPAVPAPVAPAPAK